MINNTNWASYCYAIIVLYGLYYLSAGIYYYKKELAGILGGLTLVRRTVQQDNSAEAPALYMQSVIDEVVAFFAQAGSHQYTKPEIIQSLKILLQKHAAIRQQGGAGRLERVIRAELEKGCSIRLSQAEIELLWVS